MKVWGVVPAAGAGTRMGGGEPKQYREAAGEAEQEYENARQARLSPGARAATE